MPFKAGGITKAKGNGIKVSKCVSLCLCR